MSIREKALPVDRKNAMKSLMGKAKQNAEDLCAKMVENFGEVKMVGAS